MKIELCLVFFQETDTRPHLKCISIRVSKSSLNFNKGFICVFFFKRFNICASIFCCPFLIFVLNHLPLLILPSWSHKMLSCWLHLTQPAYLWKDVYAEHFVSSHLTSKTTKTTAQRKTSSSRCTVGKEEADPRSDKLCVFSAFPCGVWRLLISPRCTERGPWLCPQTLVLPTLSWFL